MRFSPPARLAFATLLVWISALGPVARAVVAPDGAAPVRWQWVADTAPGDAPTSLVADGSGGLAVGGARGVRRVGVRGVPERLLRRGPVTDLALLEDGALLVATGQGVYRVADGLVSQRESLSVDGAARRVTRLDAARGFAVAATDRGVYLRDPTGDWQRVRVLPSGIASLVALRARDSDLELWAVIEGELWIAALRPGAEEPWRLAQRAIVPVTRASEGASDVAFDIPGADAVLVFPDVLAVRDREGVWRGLRPTLPPGARATRIAVAFGRLWLATDAGLLSASVLEGPWRRAAPPLGSLPIIGLAKGRTLAAATHRGVSIASRAALAQYAELAPIDAGRIASLHRLALRHQGLHPERLADLRDRVRKRGWLPNLHVSLGYEEERDRNRDYDQSFLSGATRDLVDKAEDRGREFDVAVTLSWDLGDAVFHPEEVDVSREARSVIALRDDVLDEVTQLYFERERVLARLAVAAPPENYDLMLRAAELAAGLDAWTGGAFSMSGADLVDVAGAASTTDAWAGAAPHPPNESTRSRNRTEELP